MNGMKNIRYSFLCLALLAAVLTGCDIKKNKDVKPEETFLKIYDNHTFSDSYYPVDIKQTSDEGFIVLSKLRVENSPFYGIGLMKLDKDGNFVSEKMLPAYLVCPANHLAASANAYYFIAMDERTMESVLVRADEQLEISEVSTLAGLTYPLNASFEESQGAFILLSYNRDDRASIVSRVSLSGTILATREFPIGYGTFDVEEPIIDHLSGNGKQLPFLSGSVHNGVYYFNGFYNYTLSMVYFSFGSTAAPGVLQGYRDERCISAALYVPESNRFALSGFAYGKNTYYTGAEVNYQSGAVASSSNLTGFPMPELVADSRVVLNRTNLNGKELLVYGSDARSGQIVLYFYNTSGGGLVASKRLGYSNTFVLGNFIKTSDDGLAILGTTYLAGRFPRLCLFKLSAQELEKILS
jgi:hypothetical protein